MNMVPACTSLDRALELQRQGFSVIPLGGGPEGKQPSVIRWKGVKFTVKAIAQRMSETNCPMYGISLEGMVVLDIDSKDGTLISTIEERFGRASVLVETPRGAHLYYASDGSGLPNLRAQRLPVDVKSGQGHYVVGPGSVRPCGGRYTEARGRLGKTPLSPILFVPQRTANPIGPKGRGPKVRRGAKVKTGERHPYLLRRAVELVRASVCADELYNNLVFVRDEELESPDSVTGGEIRNIADWAWGLHATGKLFAFDGGSFRVPRHYLQRLGGNSEAIALYTILCDKHGHSPGKLFGLSFKGMNKNGLIDLSERAFHRAKAALLKVGAVKIASNHSAGRKNRQYTMGALPQA